MKKTQALIFTIIIMLLTSCTNSIPHDTLSAGINSDSNLPNAQIPVKIPEKSEPNPIIIYDDYGKPTLPTTTSEVRGMWISYLEYADLFQGKTQTQAQAKVDNMFTNLASLGINTAVIQVRPFGDAIYPSDYFPSSHTVVGTQGNTLTYDPFAMMINAAKKYNIKIDAWINPYRVASSTDTSKLAASNQAKKWLSAGDDSAVIVNGTGIFYNPARQKAMDLIVNGVAEILNKYDVDSIHFDDYFYPTTDVSFDSKAYNEYKSAGGTMTQTNWRLDNVNRLMKAVYSKIKSIKPSVTFGISPQANINNNYTQQFADVYTWTSTPGYIDYICPQVYFGFNNQTLPYSSTVKTWNDMVTAPNVKLYIGLAAYKIGTTDSYAGSGSNEWINSKDILKRQIVDARTNSNYNGFFLYRYDFLYTPSVMNSSYASQEITNLKTILE